MFVGNAWDPSDGRETPWIDPARQLAGDAGIAELGNAAADASSGAEGLGRVFAAANGPALLLFDETPNFLNRYRSMAEPFYAFRQNLTVAVTGSRHTVAVISLPRSQVEMTDWNQERQERITKVVNRVAQDLVANDESEISEVVRRRLLADLGSARMRRKVPKTYADWCFKRNARLPAEWTAVGSAATDAKRGSSCAAALKPATRSTRPPCRCFSASGALCRISSKPAARWRCWRNRLRWRPGNSSSRYATSR